MSPIHRNRNDIDWNYGLPERIPSPSLLDNTNHPRGFFDSPPSRANPPNNGTMRTGEQVEVICLEDDDEDVSEIPVLILEVKQEDSTGCSSDDDIQCIEVRLPDRESSQPVRGHARGPRSKQSTPSTSDPQAELDPSGASTQQRQRNSGRVHGNDSDSAVIQRPSKKHSEAEMTTQSTTAVTNTSHAAVPVPKTTNSSVPVPMNTTDSSVTVAKTTNSSAPKTTSTTNPNSADAAVNANGEPTTGRGPEKVPVVSGGGLSTTEQNGTEADSQITSRQQPNIFSTTTTNATTSDLPQQINININKPSDLRVLTLSIDGKQVAVADLTSATSIHRPMQSPAPPSRYCRASTSIDCQTGASMINGQEITRTPNIDLTSPQLNQKVSEPCQTGPSLINGQLPEPRPNVDVTSPTMDSSGAHRGTDPDERSPPNPSSLDTSENQNVDDQDNIRRRHREERRDSSNHRESRSRSRSSRRRSRSRSPRPHHTRDHGFHQNERDGGHRRRHNYDYRSQSRGTSRDRYSNGNFHHNIRDGHRRDREARARNFRNAAELIRIITHCVNCNKWFPNRREAVIHQKKQHNKKYCPVCFILLRCSGHDWKNHMLKNHDVSDRMEMAKCSLCEKIFNFEGVYKHTCKAHLIPEEGVRNRVARQSNSLFPPPPAFQTNFRPTASTSAATAPRNNAAGSAFESQRRMVSPSTGRGLGPEPERPDMRVQQRVPAPSTTRVAPMPNSATGGFNSSTPRGLDSSRVNVGCNNPSQEPRRPGSNQSSQINQPQRLTFPRRVTIPNGNETPIRPSNNNYIPLPMHKRPGTSAGQSRFNPISASGPKARELSLIHISKLTAIYDKRGGPPDLAEQRDLSDKVGVELGVITSWFLDKQRSHCQERSRV